MQPAPSPAGKTGALRVDVIPSPFRAARVECESPAGLTVRQIIGEGLNLDRRQIDIAVIHNGLLVPETCWGTVVPLLGDRVTVSVVPAGGGGGKNIVALIAIIAVSVVAPFAGTAIAGALGLSGTVATLVGSGIAAGVVVGGATLVNRFVTGARAAAFGRRARPGLVDLRHSQHVPDPSDPDSEPVWDRSVVPPLRRPPVHVDRNRLRRLPRAFHGPRMRRPTTSGRSTMTDWFPRCSKTKGIDTTARNWMSSDATGKGLAGRPPRLPPDGLARLPTGPRPPASVTASNQVAYTGTERRGHVPRHNRGRSPAVSKTFSLTWGMDPLRSPRRIC